jgi:hypothetical protein
MIFNIFSFHQSINGSFANLSLNHSVKQEGSRKTKTPGEKRGGSRSAKKPVTDRFMPDRGNFEMAHYLLKRAAEAENQPNNGNQKKEASLYSRSLTESMLGVSNLSDVRVVSYTQKAKAPPEVINNFNN